MTTLSEIKLRTLDLLGEAQRTEDDEGNPVLIVEGTSTSSDYLTEGVAAALRRITARVWKRSVYTISEEGSVFVLPTDLINVEAVYSSLQKGFIPRMALRSSGALNVQAGNTWLEYPQGSITLINPIEANQSITIYYAALWDSPSLDEDVLESPSYTDTALALYATSYCFLKKASSSAEIRQFAQRIDSGQPTDIPAKEMSTFFMKRFELELNSLPMTERAIQ